MRKWMQRCVFAMSLASVVCFTNIANSQDNNASRWDADRVLKVIDLVVAQHVDPPTKQSLVAACLRSLDERGSFLPELGLGRTVSVQADSDLRAILKDSIESIQKRHGNDFVFVRLNIALSLAADCSIVDQASHQVDQSLAANRYVGIGIALGKNDVGHIMHRVVDSGPAYLAGAKDGDVILAVDGVSVEQISTTELIDTLRGPQGSEVTVKLKRKYEKAFSLTMKRNIVPFKHVMGFEVIENGIAKVKISKVSSSIVHELRQLTPQLEQKKIRGLIIELLSNDCNYQSALLFANALMAGGDIGGIQTANGIEQVEAEEDSLWPDVKIVIVPRIELSDSLAWAVNAIQFQRSVFIGVTTLNFRRDRSAWKFGTVDIDENVDSPSEKLLLKVPVAKLLGFRGRHKNPETNKQDPIYFDFGYDFAQTSQNTSSVVGVVESLRRLISQ